MLVGFALITKHQISTHGVRDLQHSVRVWCLVFRADSVGVRASGFGFRVWGLGSSVGVLEGEGPRPQRLLPACAGFVIGIWCLAARIWCLVVRVWSVGSRAAGFGFGVWGLELSVKVQGNGHTLVPQD